MTCEEGPTADAGAAPPAAASGVPPSAVGVGKELLRATRPFAHESRLRSWWSVGSTFVLLGLVLATAALAPWLALRALASLLGGLLMVRAFVLYHDYLHGAILRRSWLAQAGFWLFGLIIVTPPRSWRRTHNFHHAHVGQRTAPSTGSFPLMTTQNWRTASLLQRLAYRISRHPLTILCGYLTVFLWSICLLPLLTSPRKAWDSALSVVAHAAVVAGLWYCLGLPAVVFAFLVPISLAAALGGYLFYAQHTFEGIRILTENDWTYFRAAVETSSYMKLGRLMNWFTANIGYHHIHHVNPLIPFYRLPEVMAAIPTLQHPPMTTLHPRAVWKCLRLALWDDAQQRMVTYREAAALA